VRERYILVEAIAITITAGVSNIYVAEAARYQRSTQLVTTRAYES
jgi:hypothetical protein